MTGRDDQTLHGEPLVTRDLAVMRGEPVFFGTRIPVSAVAAMLDADTSDDEILLGYPALTPHHLAVARRWPSRRAAEPRLADLGFKAVSRTVVDLGRKVRAGQT